MLEQQSNKINFVSKRGQQPSTEGRERQAFCEESEIFQEIRNYNTNTSHSALTPQRMLPIPMSPTDLPITTQEAAKVNKQTSVPQLPLQNCTNSQQ